MDYNQYRKLDDTVLFAMFGYQKLLETKCTLCGSTTQTPETEYNVFKLAMANVFRTVDINELITDAYSGEVVDLLCTHCQVGLS